MYSFVLGMYSGTSTSSCVLVSIRGVFANVLCACACACRGGGGRAGEETEAWELEVNTYVFVLYSARDVSIQYVFSLR